MSNSVILSYLDEHIRVGIPGAETILGFMVRPTKNGQNSPIMRSDSPEIREGKRRYFRNYSIHQPVPLPPKMEDLFASSSPSPSKSSSRQGPLILPYRELGRLDTPLGVTNISNESAEASRSTAGSSGYDSGAPTNTTTNGHNAALNQLSGVGERSLTESFMARQSQRLDTSHSVNFSGTLQSKFMTPGTPTAAESEHSTSEDSQYQNHASIKLNSPNGLLPIPRISALNEQNLSVSLHAF
ncbi:unnamed protein product [Rodentolepis nana]|uniref:Velvet domain-containing protein n=1 Tax=Rodentolepis nana TaxID=102285 RepID=A0A0R3TTJ4_RODNA|nr:unnamed protein product [Rodentolepis nana]